MEIATRTQLHRGIIPGVFYPYLGVKSGVLNTTNFPMHLWNARRIPTRDEIRQYFADLDFQDVVDAPNFNETAWYSEAFALWSFLSKIVYPVLNPSIAIHVYGEVQPYTGWIADWGIEIGNTMLYISVKRMYTKHAVIQKECITSFCHRVIDASVRKMQTMVDILQYTGPEHMIQKEQVVVHLILVGQEQLEEIEQGIREVRSSLPANHILIPIISSDDAEFWWH